MHRDTILPAGILIIATILLIGFWYRVGVAVSLLGELANGMPWWVYPQIAMGDAEPSSGLRAIVALAVTIGGTVGSWKYAHEAIADRA